MNKSLRELCERIEKDTVLTDVRNLAKVALIMHEYIVRDVAWSDEDARETLAEVERILNGEVK